MIEFRFPEILFLYIPFAMFMFFDIFQSAKNKILVDIPTNLKKVLLENINLDRLRFKQNILFLSTALLIFAGSGPQIGTALAPVDRKGLDLVLCIDVSSSMRGTDIKPSRLEKSKFEISQLIKNLKGDRVAVIVFAGSSHLYLPLTTDYVAAHLFLEEIDTSMIPTQGTSLSSAMSTAISAFTEESDKFKVMLLVTDGEDHEGQAIELAEKASEIGLVINTIGVGSKIGSLIPDKSKNSSSNQYKRDIKGKLITSILNENILIEIAQAGRGSFFRFDNNRDTFIDISEAINRMEKKTISTHEYSDYENRYQLFALVSLLLLMIGLFMPTRLKIIN